MISAVTNPEHKFILILLYSTGIRREELLQLKPGDIDRDNMQIWIRSGKGKKDRYVQLEKGVLKFMDEYIGLFNPKDYLIEGLREFSYNRGGNYYNGDKESRNYPAGERT